MGQRSPSLNDLTRPIYTAQLPKKVSMKLVKNPAIYWGQEVWVWTWPVLSWISQISFQSKTRQYKPPASPFSVRKGAGFYQEKSESIVHQHKILPTYVIGHTLHHHLPTSCPTFQTFLAGSFQYTWDVNNYRDQIEKANRKERVGKRERERNGQQTALTLDPALHKNMPLPPRNPHRLCLPCALPAG